MSDILSPAPFAAAVAVAGTSSLYKRSAHAEQSLSQRRTNKKAKLYRMFYKFLGQVIGIAIRNRVTFPVQLCSLVWKPLVGQQLTSTDLFDSDESLKSILQQIQFDLAPLGDEMLEDADVQWVAQLSDGRTVDLSALRPPRSASDDEEDEDDDDEQFVRQSEVGDFVRTVIDVRLNECRSAALAIREGLCSIVPASVLSLLDWKELRALVAGREDINIDLLRSCTEYDEDVSPGVLSKISFHVIIFFLFSAMTCPGQCVWGT